MNEDRADRSYSKSARIRLYGGLAVSAQCKECL